MTINNLVHGFTSGAFATREGLVKLARVEAHLEASEGLRGKTLHQLIQEYLFASTARKSQLAPAIAYMIKEEAPKLQRIHLFSEPADVAAALETRLKGGTGAYAYAGGGAAQSTRKNKPYKLLATPNFDEERRVYGTMEEFLKEKLKAIGAMEDTEQIREAINLLLTWMEEKHLDPKSIFDWVQRNRGRVGEDFYHQTLVKIANIHGYKTLDIDRALIPDFLKNDLLFVNQGVALFLPGTRLGSTTLTPGRNFTPDIKWKFVLAKTELGLLEIRIIPPSFTPSFLLMMGGQGIARGDLTFHSPNTFELVAEPYEVDGRASVRLFQFVAAILKQLYPGVEVENTRTLLGIP